MDRQINLLGSKKVEYSNFKLYVQIQTDIHFQCALRRPQNERCCYTETQFLCSLLATAVITHLSESPLSIIINQSFIFSVKT